jgi:hypothetical protein
MPEYLIENSKNGVKSDSDCNNENHIFTENNKSTGLLQS